MSNKVKKKRPDPLKKKSNLIPTSEICNIKIDNNNTFQVAKLSNETEIEINGNKISISIADMVLIGKLGEGQYGVVDKMKHRSSNLVFAVKKIRCSMEKKEQQRLLNDLNISICSSKCPYVVISYGAMFQCGDVWICMEMLDDSLDKFYKRMPVDEFIPETLLGYITFSVVSALEFLHSELMVIHRDVKPSNVLLDRRGRVKVCDFGISGYLVQRIAQTNVGSQLYLSPERIDQDRCPNGFSIRSDVWSLGLTILELSIHKFPYAKWTSLFDQFKDVVLREHAPSLPMESPYSDTVRHFISLCLIKKDKDRACYQQLLDHELLRPYQDQGHLDVSKEQFSKYVGNILDTYGN